MPISDRYVHPLTLQRASAGTPDRSGHVEPEFLASNYVAFMGNMQERTGIEVKGPELGGTIVANAICFADPSLAPAEKDRIAILVRSFIPVPSHTKVLVWSGAWHCNSRVSSIIKKR